MTSFVGWPEVESLAKVIFRVWTDRGDLEWARTAWVTLGEGGLTTVPFERPETDVIRVRSRLLLLGAVYHTFASHAWQEGYYDPVEWAENDRELSDVDVLRLLSPEWYSELSTNDELEVDEVRTDRLFLEVALEELLEAEYPAVLKCLLPAYGGASGLFLSLWHSQDVGCAGWRRFDDRLHADVVNQSSLTVAGYDAWVWLSGGAKIP